MDHVDHDRLSKELGTVFFDELVGFTAPELAGDLEPGSAIFLDKQVFTDVTGGAKYEVDIAAKVRLRREDAYILVHIENQASAQPEFAKRMFRYFARLHESHGLPVYPIAIFSYKEPKTRQPSEYRVVVKDLSVLDFRFRAIQLNRLNWRDYLNSENPVATALMAQMNVAPKDRPKVKLECLRGFVKQGWDPARLRLLLGYVDSYLPLEGEQREQFNEGLNAAGLAEKEDVMEIVTSWEREGIAKGRREGLQEGLQAGTVQLVLRLLRRRVGALSEDREARVRRLPVERLEALGEALLDFQSVDDLDAWLGA
jgi:hypothetical protein